MKRVVAIAVCMFCFSFAAFGQQANCPPQYVCLTADEARRYLTIEDESKAKDSQIAAQKQAIDDLNKLIGDLKIEIAKLTGEKTGAEQMNVRLTAIIDFMLKNGRVKKVGLINF